jgi:DNA modification methylase
VTPPGGTVLDCFMGSGSTGKAAVSQGFGFVGIDLTPEYVATASQRISEPVEAERTNLFKPQIDEEREQWVQGDLF